MSIPTHLQYTEDHEWVHLDGDVATVGITAFAADALGDVVFVQPPRPGERISAGAACGEVESTKSVSDLYAPVDGAVVESNERLSDEPELINSDPFGDAWLFRVRIDGPLNLLSADAYSELIEAGDGTP